MNEQNYSQSPMRRIKHIHFVGIGGSGMSGIAEVLLNQGYTVSGSDLNQSKTTQHLAGLGATIFQGHAANHIKDADVVVKSSAITHNNPEIKAAVNQRIPVVPRAEMLAELMRFQFGIAIAGTHGKTTTTSLVASVLAQGGLDPTYVIGGLLNSSGTNACLGQSQYFVAEADESDASFLHLKPTFAVITNIDADHMSTYDGDFSRLRQTFIDFLHHLPFYGLAILCIDDPVVKSILPKVPRPTITYGWDNEADVHVKSWQQDGVQSTFVVSRHGKHGDIEIRLNMPGRHNVLNALAAITIATELGVSDAAIIESLQAFAGIGRRFQSHGELQLNGHRVELIDDYGHHPREIKATIQAMRNAWPEKRLVLAFQPHRYSRTHDLYDDFVKVLSEADVLLLLDIYAAGEAPIAGVSSTALCNSIRQRGIIDPIHVSADEKLATILPRIVRDNDVVMTLGAGNIGTMAGELATQCGVSSK